MSLEEGFLVTSHTTPPPGEPVEWDSELGTSLIDALIPSADQLNFLIGECELPSVITVLGISPCPHLHMMVLCVPILSPLQPTN